MRIITSGQRYLDIDAYAGIIAYAELLQKQGVEATAISTAPLNESITQSIREWEATLENAYIPGAQDTFTLIDVSDPEHFDAFVDREKVDEVIDHHPGFEEYWSSRIGHKSHIEFIGAACTQVYELWKSAGKFDGISVLSARLLICGILDNTLNFGAQVATERDRVAYAELIEKAELPENWTAQYFTECQACIERDIVTAITNDTKVLNFGTFEFPVCVGQLVVWDGQAILSRYQEVFREHLSAIKPHWFMNLVSISEGKSYFVTDGEEVKKWISNLLAIKFEQSVAPADRLWLRKEIIKQDILTNENKEKS